MERPDVNRDVDWRRLPLPPAEGGAGTERHPPLAAGAIHLWLASLDLPASDDLLSPDERARAARFVQPHHGDRFRNAHSALRRLLATHTARCPAALRFALGPAGKPRLDPPAGIEFNLSHSGPWALIGLSRETSIGVDVEQPRPLPEHAELARRTFAAAEAEALAALPEPDRLPGFFRCWTRKEAVVKALGTGISTPLDRFHVPVGTDPGPSAITGPWTGAVTLLPLAAPFGLVAAAALHGTASSRPQVSTFLTL